MVQLIRYACRSLWTSPGFAIAAILTLALGIGANTAIFSVVEGVLLAPLPFSDPDRLVMLRENSLTLKRDMSASYLDSLDWRRAAQSFQNMAALRWQEYNLTSPGTPEHLDAKQISSGFFGVLGTKLALGRDFSTQEDQHGGAPVAIINGRLWRDRFGASTAVIGKPITLDGSEYTIVGVLPSEFSLFGNEADIYTPLAQGNPLIINDRTVHPGIVCIARLKSGVTMAQANAEMQAVQSHLNQLYPDADRGLGVDVVSLKDRVVGDFSKTLLLLFGAVGLVLLIACANVANLLLVRATGRQREIAIRLALGASRSHVVRQLVAESVLLSVSGGALGLLIAQWGAHAGVAVMAGSIPRSENIGLNVPVLVFTFAVAIAVGILFGLAPAMKSSNIDLQVPLKAGGRGSVGGQPRSQRVLVIVQIAMTLVLLMGAGLLFRTLHNLWQVNPGFGTQHVLTFKVGLSTTPDETGPSERIAYRHLIERLRQIPGVLAADLTVLLPLTGLANAGPFWVGSQQPKSSAESPRALFYWTGPDYLRVMQLPLLRGRFLTADDTANSAPVVVIDSVLARAYFHDKDPIGQTIHIPHWGIAQIVGVVTHVRHWGLDDADRYTQNQIYASFYQLKEEWVPAFLGSLTIAVRTPLDTATILPAIKAVVHGAGPGQPVYRVQTMRQIMSDSMFTQRFPMALLAAFAILALLLSCIGIYGVLSYLTTQRVQEIGLRMALGADRRDVLRLVLTQGLRLTLPGILIGVASSMILARVLASFSQLLYGVRASDPLTLMAVSLALIVASVLACYLPARRAAQVDPITSLREE